MNEALLTALVLSICGLQREMCLNSVAIANQQRTMGMDCAKVYTECAELIPKPPRVPTQWDQDPPLCKEKWRGRALIAPNNCGHGEIRSHTECSPDEPGKAKCVYHNWSGE